MTDTDKRFLNDLADLLERYDATTDTCTDRYGDAELCFERTGFSCWFETGFATCHDIRSRIEYLKGIK